MGSMANFLAILLKPTSVTITTRGLLAVKEAAMTMQKQICAQAEPQTGVVWYAEFKKPGTKFLADFSWEAYERENPQVRYPLSAFMMKIHKNGNLEMRFNDTSMPALPGTTKITVEIRHPSSV